MHGSMKDHRSDTPLSREWQLAYACEAPHDDPRDGHSRGGREIHSGAPILTRAKSLKRKS
jgi:hypothetical protein